MNTLDDAWQWYLATRRNLERMQRLGKKHWDEIPWDSVPLGRDDDFRNLEKGDIEKETIVGLAPINDLAVVVLFSVFEAIVRNFVADQMGPEADQLTHPILTFAAEEAIRGVEEGSFYRRVLEPLKEQVSPNLITQVNQVRNFRNWVAHGRRGEPENNVEPLVAYNRLKEFLGALGIASGPETTDPERPG
jgi:hypothetical protein